MLSIAIAVAIVEHTMKFIDRKKIKMPDALGTSEIDRAHAQLRAHFALDPSARRLRRSPLEPTLWSNATVQASLLELFDSKCAYCESPLQQSHVIHHHRPTMNAVAHRPGQSEPSPDHYAWYAYEWRNLLAVCDLCAKAKDRAFPTGNDPVRPYTPWEDADAIESPLLLHPCVDDVFRHLAFHEDGECTATTRRGTASLKAIGLNRP